MPISQKINAVIVATLILGIGAISFYFGSRLSATIDESTVRNLESNSEIIHASIENVMLTGEAGTARSYFEDLRTVGGYFTIRIHRSDGTPAFSDNKTIRSVNNTLASFGMDLRFAERDREETGAEAVADDAFRAAVSIPAVPQVLRQHDESGAFVQLYRPLINTPRCVSCHGADHTIRGVVDIRADISQSMRNRNLVWATTGGLFLMVVLVLALLLPWFVRRIVIRPVRRIGDVCTAVTNGDFSQQIQLSQRDEVGALGATVNRMVRGLHERFELQKYVSSATLERLTGDTRGRAVELTLFFSDIRGFTSFTEENEPERVVELLNTVLSFQTRAILDAGGDIDKYVGDEIVAVFHGEEGTKRSARCAIGIQRAMAEAGDTAYGGLRVGIGIHTGSVILGMIGSEQRADFTVIGDNVNTASRYCSVAKPGEIVISESVAEALGTEAVLEGPFRATLKGKSRPQRVYKLKGMNE